jgi:DNA helicase-2/ATP-dependent DNA helicase PcrA
MSRDYHLHPFRKPVDLQIDYSRELNEQQLAAVTAPPGPALVIAGAGAGKTRTLIYRVAFLLEQGVPPERMLLLTFTNKAAREMMHRVTDLLAGDLNALWGGTFHSIGNRILRRHAALVGYSADYTILDREDAQDLIKACVNEMDPKPPAKLFPKPNVLGEIFSLAVNTRKPLRKMLDDAYPHFTEFSETIAALEQAYQTRKRSANVMDFDDLLVLWFELIQNHAEVRAAYQRRFQFLLVDEYQDTNRLQSDLIDLLAAQHHNVMAVGDDAQSIYSWRGANFQNILQFPQRYPEAKIYKIESNYRSTPEILAVANEAIAANVHQYAKQLTPVRVCGVKPVLVVCPDAEQQAAFVAQRVLELREAGAALQRMAVLYRSHFHALELQMELTRQGIPFQITSGIRFFEQAHIKDLSAYLKVVYNPKDEPAFKRLAQMLPGIGAKSANKLWHLFYSAIADPNHPKAGLAAAFRNAEPAVPPKTRAAWTQWIETMQQLDTKPTRTQPGAMIRLVMQAGYEDYLKANYTHYRSRLEDLEQLGAFAEGFSGLEEFLSQLSLLSGVDTEGNPTFAEQEGQVRLSTVHQAKGLEFDVVFVIMLCDGLFPNARAVEANEEEERRLFYVAITRARNELYLSYPLWRYKGGYSGNPSQIPSRFLEEINPALLDNWSPHY